MRSQIGAQVWKSLKKRMFCRTGHNCDEFQRYRGAVDSPIAFTEHRAIMAAMVLNSPEAVAMSVFVVRAFVQMREHLAANTSRRKSKSTG